jgi:hypothetical protein
MLSVIMLRVIMLRVIIMSAVAPLLARDKHSSFAFFLVTKRQARYF